MGNERIPPGWPPLPRPSRPPEPADGSARDDNPMKYDILRYGRMETIYHLDHRRALREAELMLDDIKDELRAKHGSDLEIVKTFKWAAVGMSEHDEKVFASFIVAKISYFSWADYPDRTDSGPDLTGRGFS